MDYFAIAKVLKPQGIRGEVKLETYVEDINRFYSFPHIYTQEKSQNTIDKYIRDIRTFTAWLQTQEQKDITKKVHIKMQKLNVNMLALY